MGLLIKILFVVALLVGGMYYFFRDTPFYLQLFPGQTAAVPTDSLHKIYADRLKLALRDNQPTDQALLRQYYVESVKQKYQAMIAENDQKNLTQARYLDIKRHEYERYIKAKYDKNDTGAIEREEWPSAEIFRLVAVDSDRNNVLTVDEMWQDERKDSTKKFNSADSNGDGALTEAEYLDEFASDSVATAIVMETDYNNNGAVNLEEVRRLFYNSNLIWSP